MTWAKVNKTNLKLIELNTTQIGFDTNNYIEVETIQTFNSVDDYIFNPATGSFYNVGVKQEIAAPSKQEIVQSAFSSADDFRFRGKGYEGLALKSDGITPMVTSVDWQLAEERFINGTHVILKGHVFNDKYDIEIVDKDYLFAGILYDLDKQVPDWSVAAPNGVVLDTFIRDWFVVSDMQGQKPIKLEYPARLLQGLYIRLNYVSNGTEDVQIKLNGFMHKKTITE